METLSEVLRNARLNKGYSPSFLAKLAGITPECIKYIESHDAKPKISTLAAMCSALDINLNKILIQFDYISEADNITLGEFVKKARLSKGYSRQKLAGLCDITVDCIRNIEADSKNPRISTLKLIFFVLDINLSETLVKFGYISESDNITLGYLIRDMRLSKGYSQQDLADLSGVPRPTITSIETGKTKNPKRSTLQLLCTVLDINFDKALKSIPTRTIK